MRAEGWVLESAGRKLEKKWLSIPAPGEAEAIVEVAACGLCHTDLGFADGSVSPRHALPLVLGHEIVGTVIAAGSAVEHLAGRAVVVPAVLPCGTCEFCQAGRGNACPSQKMPGNDIDGGFATHVIVPGRSLVVIDDAPPHVDRRELAVVADAVSTAHQAVRRASVQSGDVAFVVGAGGVGGYVTQIARASGARVIALDVDRDRLDLLSRHGAERTVQVAQREAKDVRREAHAIAKEWQCTPLHFRIFECSGTPDGQKLAFALLSTASTLVQVGYTPKSIECRLSNVMAFDATIHGSWGCPPALYPEVLRAIYTRAVTITPFVEHAGMSRINDALDDMTHHRLTRRLVLDPRN